MGSLAWAGAIGGAGEGLRAHTKGRRETRMQDDEQAHEVQLQTQRDKAAETRATSRETFDVSQADIQQKRDVGMADVQQERDVGLADARYERDVGLAKTLYDREAGLQERNIDFNAWKTSADNESREFIAMFGKWSSLSGGGAGSKGSAGEWDVEFENKFDQDGNVVTSMKASHPSGVAMEQVGDRLVHVTDAELREEGLSEFEDPEMQAKEERTLWNELEKGNDTGQEFLKAYKYLPHWYMVKKFEADNADQLGEFWDYFNRDRGRPVGPDMEGRLLPRNTREREAGADPGRGQAAPAEIAPAAAPPAEPPPAEPPSTGTPAPSGRGPPVIRPDNALPPRLPSTGTPAPSGRGPPGGIPHPGGALMRGAWDVLSSGGKAGGIVGSQQ